MPADVLVRFCAISRPGSPSSSSSCMRCLQRLTSSFTSKRAVGATSVSESNRCQDGRNAAMASATNTPPQLHCTSDSPASAVSGTNRPLQRSRLGPKAAEAMLPKPFGVFPGANFVQRPRISKDHQYIQLIRRREVLREPLLELVIVDQPGWVRVRVVWHPRRLVVSKRVCWAIGGILDEASWLRVCTRQRPRVGWIEPIRKVRHVLNWPVQFISWLVRPGHAGDSAPSGVAVQSHQAVVVLPPPRPLLHGDTSSQCAVCDVHQMALHVVACCSMALLHRWVSPLHHPNQAFHHERWSWRGVRASTFEAYLARQVRGHPVFEGIWLETTGSRPRLEVTGPRPLTR